jgi:hypothetical protein
MKRVRQVLQLGGGISAEGITLAHRQDRNRVVSVGSRAAGADAVQAGHGRRQPDGPVSNFIDRRRPTGCRSRQAGSPDVSEPWAHPRSTPRSFAAFADCHAISRATGCQETRTRHSFRCFSLCPSLFGRATSKTRQLLRGCDMNAVYFVSPARRATPSYLGAVASTNVSAIVMVGNPVASPKCGQKGRISGMRVHRAMDAEVWSVTTDVLQ